MWLVYTKDTKISWFFDTRKEAREFKNKRNYVYEYNLEIYPKKLTHLK